MTRENGRRNEQKIDPTEREKRHETESWDRKGEITREGEGSRHE